MDAHSKYDSLVSKKSLLDLSSDEALKYIGELTDLSLDLRKIDGLKLAIKLNKELQERDLSKEQVVISNYFMANAWSNIRMLSTDKNNDLWKWEQEEIEKEIIYLRKALTEEGLKKVPKVRRCQILTNLGNCFSYVGRFIEAIEYWDKALSVLPSFAIARGNKGYGLAYYGQSLYDIGHIELFLRYAYIQLKNSISSELVHKNARTAFQQRMNWIKSVLPIEILNKEFKMDRYSLGSTDDEINYRKWCLENRLFLNPLNDLGSFSIAGQDIFNLPNIATGIGEGPYYLGFFNQMKQEYVSARYLYYEGINANEPHFSDKNVFLYNTLDYPVYSLAIEKVKASYIMVYSLFDKIAYFINIYLDLTESKVYFRTLWYESQNKSKRLKAKLQKRKNWPLRGLFWLSKDLYEDKPGFRDAIEPEAKEIAAIRNHLEHKYLKIHDGFWNGLSSKNDKLSLALVDSLAYSMYRKDFEAKTLKLIKLSRVALMYLSLAVHSEELQRAQKRGSDEIVMPMYLNKFEDDWKT